jgi:hypothetical protein
MIQIFELITSCPTSVDLLEVQDSNGTSRDVVNCSRGFVDEVMVTLDVRIKDDGTLRKSMSSEKTFRGEKVQRVVDRGT